MKTYAIRQTYLNYQTGESWTRVLPKRYKTRRGAERTARESYRWITRPHGRNAPATDSSDAEVIELGGAS